MAKNKSCLPSSLLRQEESINIEVKEHTYRVGNSRKERKIVVRPECIGRLRRSDEIIRSHIYISMCRVLFEDNKSV